jgi:uncharacterized protein YifE (UPF0438 family)
MNNIDIRHGKCAFADMKRFPYGFRKSGDFSITEATILSTFGHTLQALEQGQLEPNSSEENHFVSVAKGFASPQTAVERAWNKYRLLTSTRKNFFTLNSKSMASSAANDEEDDFDSSDLEIEA